jgi:transposase
VAAAAAGELGCGSPATVWRRLNEWAKAGVFDALHIEVLDRLGLAGRLDWSRANVDTISVRAKRRGGDLVGANPVDRGKPGSKLHLVTDGHGLPLAVAVTAANVNDATMFEALLADVPAVLGPSGRRRCPWGARSRCVMLRSRTRGSAHQGRRGNVAGPRSAHSLPHRALTAAALRRPSCGAGGAGCNARQRSAGHG